MSMGALRPDLPQSFSAPGFRRNARNEFLPVSIHLFPDVNPSMRRGS